VDNCSLASFGTLLARQPDPNTWPNLKPQILVLNYTPIFVDEVPNFPQLILNFKKYVCVCVCVILVLIY
jgi:hypothetical protein